MEEMRLTPVIAIVRSSISTTIPASSIISSVISSSITVMSSVITASVTWLKNFKVLNSRIFANDASSYSVNPNISRIDLVTFYNIRESCLEKQGKKEFRKSHQNYAAYNRVNTVVQDLICFKLSNNFNEFQIE